MKNPEEDVWSIESYKYPENNYNNTNTDLNESESIRIKPQNKSVTKKCFTPKKKINSTVVIQPFL